MEKEKDYRHTLLYYFRKEKNASQAYKKLCAVYGDKVLKERFFIERQQALWARR